MSDLPESAVDKLKKVSLTPLIIAGIIFVIFICLVSRCSSDSSEPEVDKGDRIDAYLVCQDFVSEDLKSPATAEFASMSDSIIKNTSGDSWSVTSYVDAQNSFGAMLRMYFVCDLTYRGDGYYRLENLDFGN
jgi:hypothetical protein